MSIIENKIAFPPKMGKIMLIIFFLIIPYLIENRLEKFGFASIKITAIIWAPFLIMSLIYIFFWIKADEKNTLEEKTLEIMKERNKIEESKVHYDPRGGGYC
jgi:hypothetical protein